MLTAKKIEALIKSGTAGELPDGFVRGLYFVPPKSWALRYRYRRRPRKYTLKGHWPEVGLPLARRIATELWGDIARG